LQAQLIFVEYDPIISEQLQGYPIDKTLNEIIEHLEKGKKLIGMTLWMHNDWKKVIEQTQIKGRTPETREHFVALRTFLELRAARTDLLGRWQRQMTPLGAPDANTLGPAPESICIQFVFQLRQCLEWYTTTWQPLEQQLRQQGLLWERFLAEMPAQIATEYGELLRLKEAVQIHLRPLLEAEINYRQYQSNDAKLLELKQQLSLVTSTAAKTEVVQRLQIAVDNHDAQAYSEAIERLVDLQERQKEQHYRYTLLAKLEKSAPNWAAAIQQRGGVHGQSEPPGNPQTAWLWRQLHDELDRRNNLSLEDAQERIVRLNHTLQEMTTELVEKKAWAAQMRRTTGEQRQALNGWKELMRKAGKGTGKRAAKLLAEARMLMPKCQTAVPVWIMPLSRVVQNFNPRQNRFDVVIIDEASQADIKALAALYMGEQIVIVGDDEQVTPLAVGQKIDNVEQLIAEHLQGIPLSAMYDGKLSIYQLAKTAPGFQPICLREHFRCVSPIIQFCNNLSYNGKIKPLRDDSEVQLRPPTVAYQVKSNDATGHVNKEEAVTIASLLIAASKQSEYQNATFGVISMVDDEQALYIDTLLNRHLRPADYARHRILCGNPAQFQGDERDVIFLSMVDVPKRDGPLRLHSEDASDYMYKKRFNVAVSRARDQLWVVHSLDPGIDLKDGDIRKKLILHASNPRAFASELEELEKRTDSEFERQVLRRLTHAGYHVTPQWPVGAYRIDFVVEGAGRRLAVECDGDRWHPIEKLEEDMARQAILERLGWRFVRIRGSQFFRDPEQAMAPVFARLNALEIPPESSQHTSDQANRESNALQERIIRCAAELRQEWAIASNQADVSPIQPASLHTQRRSAWCIK
jgi:very-short-patch-repair endonuclease